MGYPLYKVIQHRGQNIDDQHTAEAERQQTSVSYTHLELELFGNKFTIHENNPKTKRIYEAGEKAKIELDISDIHII